MDIQPIMLFFITITLFILYILLFLSVLIITNLAKANEMEGDYELQRNYLSRHARINKEN